MFCWAVNATRTCFSTASRGSANVRKTSTSSTPTPTSAWCPQGVRVTREWTVWISASWMTALQKHFVRRWDSRTFVGATWGRRFIRTERAKTGLDNIVIMTILVATRNWAVGEYIMQRNCILHKIKLIYWVTIGDNFDELIMGKRSKVCQCKSPLHMKYDEATGQCGQ